MKNDILIAGVGGQGTVLASRLIAAAALEQNYFVRTAETIGMAQRGGCVVSHVRIASEEKSALIPLHTADALIAFEPAEAARNLNRLGANGKCILNKKAIIPVTSALGIVPYQVEEIMDYIRSIVPHVVVIDGESLAEKAGSVKAVNTVLLGAAMQHGLLPFGRDFMIAVIKKALPEKFIEMNLKAFDFGYFYTGE